MSKRLRPRISPVLATMSLLLALNLLNYIDRYILPGAQPLIQREFRATDQQMGALTTALFFFYMFAAPASGWLGDWFRRKPLIITGAVLWSVATLGSAFVHSYWSLYMSRAMVGVGEATFGIFAPAVLSDFYPERERNRILTIFYIAIPVGAALGYLAGGEMGSQWGWRSPFLICAIPGLLVAVLFGFLGREPERGASDRGGPTGARTMSWRSFAEFIGQFFKLLRNPAFLTSTFGLAEITFALGGISAWVPTFLHRANGLSVANASLVVSAITVIDGIGGTVAGGWIAHRWLRTDHRALYLLSFWSVVLTLPFGILVFFGPHAFTIPGALSGGVFHLSQYRSSEYRDRELRQRRSPRHGNFGQPLLHSRIRRHLLAADYRRHQRPLNPEHRPGRDAGFAHHRVRHSVVRRSLCIAVRGSLKRFHRCLAPRFL